MSSSPAHAIAYPKFLNILYATDFSPGSEAALPCVRAVAERYGSTVHVVHVLDGAPVFTGEAGALSRATVPGQEAARQHLDALTRSRNFKGILYTQTLEQGEIYAILSKLVAELSIDLIILGTHGRRTLGQLALGSIAEQIFRGAACPVMTVGPESGARVAEGGFRCILYATDFSPASLNALKYAAGLTHTTGAELVLLHAIEETSDFMLPYIEGAAKDAEECLSDLARIHGIRKFRVVVQCGPAGETILELGDRIGADLMVLGAHRGASVAGHLPWAVAHMVACRAPCPVLTVRG